VKGPGAAAERFYDRWDRFWFAPVPTSTLALVRMGVGLVAFLYGATLLIDARALIGPEGVVPAQPGLETPITVLAHATSDTAAVATVVVLIVAAVCVVIGLGTRVAALVLFVAMLSVHRRDPFMLNGGDLLLRCQTFFLVLMPSGASFSVDRWLRTRRIADPAERAEARWRFPTAAPWGLRLLQVQMSLLYLDSVWEKLPGESWRDGTAVGRALRVEEFRRLAMPGWFVDSDLLIAGATWGTLVVELALAVGVWSGRWRPRVLLAGIALHLGIEVTMALGFFAAAIFAGYLAFVSPDVAARWLRSLRRRSAHRPAEADHLAERSPKSEAPVAPAPAPSP
jgi:uncharacterized membrane protein YphA (DoxX/SURF4 family)